MFVLLGPGVFCGCNKSPYEVSPVEGKITVGGKPISNGRVMFAPVGGGQLEPGKPAFGVIDSTGDYTLRTYRDGDGAVVGEHSVTIFDTSSTPRFSRLALPQRFLVVGNQTNRIDVDLTDELIKRFGVK